ncbi:hypothetical protein [Aliiroseovarius marinus]|uniref:hypothetical protein n=1 Tax=Aliiroseovarius marinus TaxID=2500159 RepID=UPI003D7D9651
MLRLALVLAFLSWPITLSATPLDKALPGAVQRGQATFSYFGVPLYDARLFTLGGAKLDWQQDFALELKYKRRLSENDLIQATLREMARMGGQVPIASQLATCFQDVNRSDTYLAITDGPDRIRFWRNGQPTCTLSYPRIKRRFMDIFLGQKTQSARFTRRLKGM